MSSEKQTQTQRTATSQPPFQLSLDNRTPSNLQLLTSNSRFGPRAEISGLGSPVDSTGVLTPDPVRGFGAIPGHCISNRQPQRLEPIATHRKQTTETKSNSQLSALFHSVYLQPVLSRLPVSNRQLETIRNGRNSLKTKEMTFSNRPKKQRGHRGGKKAGGTPALQKPEAPAGSQRYEDRRLQSKSNSAGASRC